ncbi:hypothetical protein N9Y79_04240 [Alphaproteobacteria bacterium]|nr:hypothetical protein [Alphaproteobacteria bacterium]
MVEKGSDVIKRVYRLSDVFPKSEAQLRSIMDGANEIEAEGYGKTEGDGYFNLGLNYLFWDLSL